MAFWKWWTVIVLTCASVVLVNQTVDLKFYVVDSDKTHLSLVILAIFAFVSAMIGYFNYYIHFKNQSFNSDRFNLFWFASDAVLTIGMIGTLIGFQIVLTNGFAEFDNTSVEQMKKVISHVAIGMGIAIITTLTGLVCGLIMKYQLVMLDGENAKLQH